MYYLCMCVSKSSIKFHGHFLSISFFFVNKACTYLLLLLLYSDNGSAMVYKGGSHCMNYRVKIPRIEISNIIKDLFEATSDSLLGHLGGATHWARVRGVVEYYSIGK